MSMMMGEDSVCIPGVGFLKIWKSVIATFDIGN